MCVLCCIITIMKTLDSKKKGARHQAQCSDTNWVEKFALPQCIFHRACFKTKNQLEISTAWWSKESAELPEKKKEKTAWNRLWNKVMQESLLLPASWASASISQSLRVTFLSSDTWNSQPLSTEIYLETFYFSTWYFFINFIYLFLAVLGGSSLLRRLFSSCGKWGLLSSCSAYNPHCGGFSCCKVQPLECSGFSSCGLWALGHRLSSCDTQV